MGAMIPPNVTDPGQPDITPPDSAPAAADYEVSLRSLSQWELAWRKFRQHRRGLVGPGVLLWLLLAAFVGAVFGAVTPVPPGPNKLVDQHRPAVCIPYGERNRARDVG